MAKYRGPLYGSAINQDDYARLKRGGAKAMDYGQKGMTAMGRGTKWLLKKGVGKKKELQYKTSLTGQAEKMAALADEQESLFYQAAEDEQREKAQKKADQSQKYNLLRKMAADRKRYEFYKNKNEGSPSGEDIQDVYKRNPDWTRQRIKDRINFRS